MINLTIFNNNLFNAGTELFSRLGIRLNSNTAVSLGARELLKDYYKDNDIFNAISETYFLGLVDDSVFDGNTPLLSKEKISLKEAESKINPEYKGLMVFAVKLNDSYLPVRGKIAELTRAFNRASKNLPVVLLLKYGGLLSFAASERTKYKQAWREGEKIGKISLLKDINLESPHTGHLKILDDLKVGPDVTTFDALYKQWQEVFNVQLLNKKFYQELANWYFWANKTVSFPDDAEKKKDIRNATNVIRLITRMIFVWFVKEKGLIPDKLFDPSYLKDILNYSDETGSSYYKAILQNLFFATLNTEMDKDKPGSRKFVNRQYGIHYFYRYERFFSDKKKALDLFKGIPFLNGGLFECLDKNVGQDNEIRIDCFSNSPAKAARLIVPDELFFSTEQPIDLNGIYGTKGKSYKVKGLINILNSYKFTIAENTPVEEEIALDPELLGKVFENLLAAYNPETQTTARKQTGSFYTPREIVNYMVDESIIAYLSSKLPSPPAGEGKGEGDNEARLRHLLSYSEDLQQFKPREVGVLINAIDKCKILDPACGSGAFPMGILHKLTHILHKLDPNNEKWKQKQIDKVMEVPDATVRDQLLDDIDESFQNNELDYGRKLYLIENCIYGLDIQPIAVQIAKLRFFISLIVDQRIDDKKKNLGIRPLPNLETKFIAANTLIGIEKPAQMMFRNPEIDRKEKELKEVRERHFTARTPQTKEKYRKADERLRAQISELLKNDRFPRETTEKLSKWDPYDQNASADFFDPEWMFGITEGFDVVIGNPPYHQLSKDISAKRDYKDYLKAKYKTSGGRLNTFIFFIHEGIELLIKKGNLIYIIPNTFLTQEYYKETRHLLRDAMCISQIVHYPTMQFENAVVENITIQVTKNGSSEKTKYYIQDSDKTHLQTEIDLKLKSHPPNFSFNVGNNSILDKIEEKEYVKLNDLCEINQAIALIGDRSLSLRDSNPKGTFYRLIDGRNISKYSIKWGGVYLDYKLDRIHSCKRKDIFETSNKLLFRRVSSNLIFAYDDEQYYALNTLVVLNKKKSTTDIKYLLGLLNSKLMNYYYKEKFKSTKKVFSEIQARSVGNLPIIYPTHKDKSLFLTLVDQILAAKKKDPNTDTSALEKQIDEMVYALYGLTPEEIAIVKGKG